MSDRSSPLLDRRIVSAHGLYDGTMIDYLRYDQHCGLDILDNLLFSSLCRSIVPDAVLSTKDTD